MAASGRVSWRIKQAAATEVLRGIVTRRKAGALERELTDLYDEANDLILQAVKAQEDDEQRAQRQGS